MRDGISNHEKQNDEKKVQFYVNSSIITKKSFLRFIKGYPREEYAPSWPPLCSSVCPKANIYYAFNEDTNPFTRLETACKCPLYDGIQPHFEPPREPFTVRDPYSEDEARRKYLETNPTSFAIFGKPDLNGSKLAAMIADTWNCVLISPQALLKEEIEKQTEKGRLINEILQSGRCVGPDIILDLIHNRISMRDVMHKGYVVEGLPFIPNYLNLDYSSYPETANDETDQTDNYFVCHKFDISPGNDEIHSYVECKPDKNYEEEVRRQINDIFTSWRIKPRIIIYIICPDEDAFKKREYVRLNPHTGEIVDTTDEAFQRYEDIQSHFSREEIENDIDFDIYQEILSRDLIFDEDHVNHFLRRIFHTKENADKQYKFFKRVAIPVIDKWICAHNPQNIIRVDGRTSLSRMLQIVSARLRILSIPRVILPKRLIEQSEFEIQGEINIQTSPGEEFEGMSNEDAFRELIDRNVVSPLFPWRLSAWKFFCPVELARGRTVEGFPKYTVRFMNKIFFLSSPEAVDVFIENPRTFLSPPNPKPPCRIAVFGPKYSGKSELSKQLAHDLNGIVIDVNKLEEKLIEDRRNTNIIGAIHEMRDSVIEELRKNLETEREKKESSRLKELQSWYDDISKTIDRFMNILELIKNQGENIIEDNNIEEELESTRQKLQKNNLLRLETDLKLRERIKKDKDVLYSFAPSHLAAKEPSVRELTEHDPEVGAILEDRVRYLLDEEIEITADEKAEMIASNIEAIPAETLIDGLQKYSSFVIDGMYPDFEVWKKITEEFNVRIEHIILILEDKPYEYLIAKWREFYKLNKLQMDEEMYESYEDINYDLWDTDTEEVEMKNEQEIFKLKNYIDHVEEFQLHWQDFENKIEEFKKNIIIANLQTTNNILQYVENRIKSQYEWKPIVMSDEEKEKERIMLENLAELALVKQTVEEEEEEDEEKDIAIRENLINTNRRLGDTNYYCPVALSKNILLKGSEEYSAIFLDKIYLLSSLEALEEFVENPKKFLIPFLKPPATIPPLRICIIGPPGSGKSSISDFVAKEYGLTHIIYLRCFTLYMKERGMLPPISEHSLVILQRLTEEEIDLPEDLTDDRYNSDKATVLAFIQKFVQQGGELPKRMLNECLLKFFQLPYANFGLVLDGFPSCSQDMEIAFEYLTVPELIIELTCDPATSFERKLFSLFELWKKNQEEQQRIEDMRYNEEMKMYLEKRTKWIRKVLAFKRKQRKSGLLSDAEEYEYDESGLENSSSRYTFTRDLLQITLSDDDTDDDSDSSDSDLDQEMIYKKELEEIWRQEYPEPVLFTDWEAFEDAKERITQDLERKCESDAEKLMSIRTFMENRPIPLIEVDAQRNFEVVILEVLKILDPYVFRDTSMFERTYNIDLDTAERLLECGYYLLSSFGRICPVQLYEKTNPFQMFLLMEAKDEICPVIHRSYIYFLAGKEAHLAFAKNPLKYLEQDSCLPLIPPRISVIGPPKCGKTTLAERFAKTYGMKLISRGTALRYVLKNYPWTNLAEKIKANLQNGESVSEEHITRAVEMYSIDPRAASQGFIFDGFPCSRAEAEKYVLLGLQPMIVLDLKANLDSCLEYLVYDNDNFKRPPNFSSDFITHRYSRWYDTQEEYRDWLKKFAGNVVEIDASKSKWYVWSIADEAARSIFSDMIRYFRKADYETVLDLKNMCVSPYEFKNRQSQYESYCPLCLFHDHVTNYQGSFFHREGMVQFKDHFYRICARHMTDFLKDPLKHLPPENTEVLPENRPKVLEEEVNVEHICWARRLRADGFCVVTYVDNLPRRNLIPGKKDLAVFYNEKLYLFCTEKCRDKFLSRFTEYSKVDIHFPRTLSPIETSSLPDLGFLEQIVADLVIKAVNHVGMLRPKIPGLSAAATAAIYIGVYLKVHNVSCTLKEVAIYQKVSRRLEAFRRIIKMAIRSMKKKLNPYVSVPKETYTISKVTEQPSVMSQISLRSVNFIKFRRTSPTQTFIDPDEDENV